MPLWTRILYGSVAKWSLQNCKISQKNLRSDQGGGGRTTAPLKYATESECESETAMLLFI